MLRRIAVWCAVGLVASTVLAPMALAQGRPGGRGGQGGQGGPGGFDREATRQRMQAMRYADSMWTALVFEVKISDQKLIAVRSDFQAHYDARQKAREAAAKNEDRRAGFEEMAKAIETANATLEKALKSKLSEAEYAKAKKIADESATRGFGGRGGGGQGGRGGGGQGGGGRPGGGGGRPQ